MALVLFNIGWMKYYRGQTDSDGIVNGGKFVDDNKTGFEIENFLPIDRRYVGYVQPRGNRVNLERLGAAPGAAHVDGVTAAFTATRPERGTVVVGWYRNARVWREAQPIRDREYFARAPVVDCTLLPVDERVFSVPRAGHPKGAWGVGRSNVRYLDEGGESAEFARRLGAYIDDPSGVDLPQVRDDAGRRGPGRQPDPALRAEVEKAAIAYVIEHYGGYAWKSVESENKGWDLEFTRGAVKLCVEVKGCSGGRAQAELTPNEFAAMSRRHRGYRLAIVARAFDKPRLYIISYNARDDTWRDQQDREVNLKELTGARVVCA